MVVEVDGLRVGGLPNFLVIGAEKGGTSWLWQNLRRHPEVFMPDPPNKEIHFFNKEGNWCNGLAWYQTFFEGNNGERVVGEATPGYLPSPVAAGRIRETFEEIKLLAILRDPITRAYSSYRMGVSKLYIPPVGFLEAVKTYPHLVRNGLYGGQLRRYLDLFQPEELMVLFFEDVMANKRKAISQINKFLGVSDSVEVEILKGHHAASRDIRIPVLNRVAFQLAKVLRGRRGGGFYLLGSRGRSRVRRWFFRWNTKLVEGAYQGPSSEERERMLPMFDKDIGLLEDSLGVDLEHWKSV